MNDVLFNEAGDIVKYSDEVEAAMKLLAPLLARGHVVVGPDELAGGQPYFYPAGKLRFHRRRAAAQEAAEEAAGVEAKLAEIEATTAQLRTALRAASEQREVAGTWRDLKR